MATVFSARLEAMMSWASSLTRTPATPGSCGTENKCLSGCGVEHVDGAVSRVRHIDVSTRARGQPRDRSLRNPRVSGG